jgi:hypothetical protein
MPLTTRIRKVGYANMRIILFLIGLATAGLSGSPEEKAVAFLTRDVPAWSRDNGCFSCHNNGDAARALYAASRRGHRIPPEALAATTAWIRAPHRWKENKGDPGFSDKRLADVQFASALLAAVETGHVADRAPLEAAARLLLAAQAKDGSWRIDAGATLGSPATYGTPLATWMALRVLRQSGLAEARPAARRAGQWLRRLKPVNLLAASTRLLAATGDSADKHATAAGVRMPIRPPKFSIRRLCYWLCGKFAEMRALRR